MLKNNKSNTEILFDKNSKMFCENNCKSDDCGNKKRPKLTFESFVENTGIEPVTSCLPGKRSSQMS